MKFLPCVKVLIIVDNINEYFEQVQPDINYGNIIISKRANSIIISVGNTHYTIISRLTDRYRGYKFDSIFLYRNLSDEEMNFFNNAYRPMVNGVHMML